MSSQWNLEKVRRETGGDEPSLDQKNLPIMAPNWLVCRGRGHSGSTYTV
jgi:hypothetical protein